MTVTVNQPPAITSANSTTFTAGTSGSFQVMASGAPAPTFTQTGALPSGVTLSSSGLLSGTPAANTGGTYPITITATNACLPASAQGFTLTVNQAPAFTSANSTTFVVGTAGSFNVTASGFPAPTFSTMSALPNGVTLSSAGVLSGTPMPGTGGVYNLVLSASNGVGTAPTQNFTLTVNQAPAITSANSTSFTIGNVGNFTVQASGFPAPTLSESGALPMNVTFTPGSGLLGGIPANGTAGTYPLQFTAANGVGSNNVQNFSLAVNDAVCVAAPSNLIAWFPGEGDATDVTGGINGSALNGAGFAAGKVGQGFTFNGATSVVQVPDNPAWNFGANAFTVQTWVKFNAVASTNIFLGHDDGGGVFNKWIFWLQSGSLAFHLNGSASATITSSATFTPVLGQWHHVAVTRSGTTYRFYVDGVQNGTDRFDGNVVPTATAPLTLGQAEAIAAIDGMLDEVQIFNRALSAAEIQSVYNASTKGLCFDAPQALSAVSRETHGGVGDFDVPLPLTGTPGVECRTGGANGDHTIVVTFNNVVTAGTATVSAGSVVGSPSFSGNRMTINLTNVPNAQTITLTLSDVKDGFGQTLPGATVPMDVLLGDTTANKAVTASDIAQTKAQSGNPAGAGNFRTDINADGSVDASDVSMVKAASGTGIP